MIVAMNVYTQVGVMPVSMDSWVTGPYPVRSCGRGKGASGNKARRGTVKYNMDTKLVCVVVLMLTVTKASFTGHDHDTT